MTEPDLRHLALTLRSPLLAEREAAQTQLIDAAGAAVPALAAELDARHPIACPLALQTLGQIGGAAAIEAVVAFAPNGFATDMARRSALGQLARPLEGRIEASQVGDAARLIAALRDVDVVRALALINALERLARRAPNPALHDALPALRACTGDDAPSPLVAPARKVLAAAEVGAAGVDADALVPLLRSLVADARYEARSRLKRLGATAVPALIAEMARRHPVGECQAIEALGEIGGAEAARALWTTLTEQTSTHHGAIDRALAAALAPLVDAPRRDDGPLLVDIVERYPLTGPSAKVAARALESLARTDPYPELRRALDALAGTLSRPVPRVFTAAAAAIAAATDAWKEAAPPPRTPSVDDPTLVRLIERLADADYATRKHAVALLVERGPEAVGVLIAALDDPRLTVRVRAVEALGRIGAPAAAIPLGRIVRQPEDPALLAEAAIALTRLSQGGVNVAESLARYDRDALQDGGPPPRALLVRDREASDRLPLPPPAGHRAAPMFTGDDPEALIVHLRSTDYATRKAAGERLAELGAAAVPALSNELERRHPLSGPRAVQTLAETGHPDAVAPLVGLRAGNDYDLVSARHHALEALALRLKARAFAEDDLAAIAQLLGALPVYSPALIALAEYLVRWAKTAPCPGLRRVLKPMRFTLLRPVPAYVAVVRREIDQATARWKDLPLPAAAPDADSASLPRPSEAPDGP